MPMSLQRLVPLLALVSIVLAGTAWAGTDDATVTVSTGSASATAQNGSSQPPSVRAQAQKPQQIAASASAETPHAANGGSDHRLFMLMMMSRVWSAGPF